MTERTSMFMNYDAILLCVHYLCDCWHILNDNIIRVSTADVCCYVYLLQVINIVYSVNVYGCIRHCRSLMLCLVSCSAIPTACLLLCACVNLSVQMSLNVHTCYVPISDHNDTECVLLFNVYMLYHRI